MVLVDTSVWIQHFRKAERGLADCLANGLVLMHPFIAGELACGNLRNRAVVLSDLENLPQTIHASHGDALRLLKDWRLSGRLLGWIDLHLLASSIVRVRVLDSGQAPHTGRQRTESGPA